MTKKIGLYIGLLFILLGILLKIFSTFDIISILLIVIGVVFKLVYLLRKVRHGYKPGIEFVFLIVGLSLFLPAVYVKSIAALFNPLYIMIPGLLFKCSFVMLFIRKMRKKI